MRCRATATHSTAELALTDQRGVAMLMTLMVMLMLAALTMAFTMLGASEPQIAANLQQSTEAMGLAEAGIERVIWGLNNPAAPGGLPFPLPATIPAPYDGTTDIALGTGVYRVTVTAGATNTEAVVTSEGRVPNWGSYRAQRKITANVTGLPKLEPPCAVCMKGKLELKNKTILDGRTSSCGSKQGSHSTASTSISGVDATYGAFANDASPSVPNQATDYSENVAASSFDSFTLTQDQLNLLKDLAKANGTYYKGTKTFEDSMPSGIIFVDTVNGNPIDPLNPSNFGSLTLDGDVGTVKGWIVVMGNFSGPDSWQYSGLVYVANKMARYRPELLTGANSTLSGAIIVQNVSDSTDAFRVQNSGSGTNTIQYNCDNIKTGGSTYPPFFVRPGSWRELSG